MVLVDSVKRRNIFPWKLLKLDINSHVDWWSLWRFWFFSTKWALIERKSQAYPRSFLDRRLTKTIRVHKHYQTLPARESNFFEPVQNWVLTTGKDPFGSRLQLAKRHLIGLSHIWVRLFRIESLDLIKRTTFHQNQFMTCYLIFNFRATYFSYFQKISANSNSHYV